MKRWLGVVAVGAMVLSAVSPVAAQLLPDEEVDQFIRNEISFPITYGFEGAGARALGMGSAFLAISDDISGFTWNPAGIWSLEVPIVHLSFGTNSQSGTVLGLRAGNIITGPSESDISTLETDNLGSLNGLNMFAVMVPFEFRRSPWVFGVSYSRTFEESEGWAFQANDSVDWVPTDEDNVADDPFAISLIGDTERRVDVINVGFSTKPFGRVAIGATINVYQGSGLTNEQQLYFFGNHPRSFPTTNPTDLQPTNFQSTYSYIDSLSYSGLNFTIGAKYVSENVNIGATIRTPFRFRQTSNFIIDSLEVQNGLQTNPLTQAVLRDDYVSEVEVPFFFGIGGAINVSENWLWVGEVQYRPFSGTDFRFLEDQEITPTGERIEEFETEPTLYEDAYSLRLGTEYLWNTGSDLFPVVPLRAGVKYDALPTFDRGLEVTLDGVTGEVIETRTVPGDQTTATSFSLGTGLRWSQIHLDLAYTYTSYTQGFVTQIDFPARPVETTDGNVFTGALFPSSETEARNHRFVLSFTGYF